MKKILMDIIKRVIPFISDMMMSNKKYDNKMLEEYNTNMSEKYNNEINETYEISDDYTYLDIKGAKIKFKTLKDTTFWNCNDNFGALEIDTVFICSEGGKEIEDYSDMNRLSISFQTEEIEDKSDQMVGEYLKSYNISNFEVTKLENSVFTYKIVGESNSAYFESYFLEYSGEMDGEEFDVYYQIKLDLNKNIINAKHLHKAKKEYKTIIDTLEFV